MAKEIAARSVLGALALAWFQEWARRTDQRPGWLDGAIWLGLAAGWLVARKGEK